MEDNPFRVRGAGVNRGALRQGEGEAIHNRHGHGAGRGDRHGAGRGDRHGAGRGYRHDGGRGDQRGGGHGERDGRGRGDGRGGGRGGRQGRGHFQMRGEDDQRNPGARPVPQRLARPPPYKALEALLDEKKDPENVVQELMCVSKGFESLLRQRELRRDMKALVIKVLAKVCECESAPQSVIRVLTLVTDTDFLNISLSQHINTMLCENDSTYLRGVPDQIKAILKLLDTLMQRVKQSMKDAHVVLTLIDVVSKTLETKGYPISQSSKILLSQLLLYCMKIEKDKAHKTQRQITSQETPPPNDFREIPIFPGVEEINTNALAYLRANVVHGQYKDLNHYLDVQFRLLRQDFLEPLQLGIAEYHISLRETDVKRKLKDIRIYHDVSVHFPICTNEGITHRVSFDITKFRKVRWQATKRLTFGSLVCLSKDNFQSVIFATVANRNPKDLEEGLVDLRFQDMTQVATIDSSDSFIMAESSAYFEAYRHVLEGLQEVRDDTLPLQRYIIEVSSDVHPPEYLRHNRRATYNLSCISQHDDDDDDDDPFAHLRLRRRIPSVRRVEVLDTANWPSAESLQLDESQLEAVQAALTQELAIIQGPPGTGKTYIGLKIVKALLRNISVWRDDEERNPILVVCYTNHALDQFLEGILEFSKNIVRVGGRSNSEDMKSKNLNFLKREQRRNRNTPRAVHNRTGDILREMYNLRQCMEVSQKKVEKSMNGVISEEFLQPFMSARHYVLLTSQLGGDIYSRGRNHCYILEWLGLTGNFYVASRQEMGFAAAFMQGQEQDEPEDDEQEEEEEIEVEEEADLIAGQRILDDEEEDLFLFEEEPHVNHIVLDVNDLGTGPQQPGDEYGWQIQGHQKKRMKKMLLHNLRKTDRMSESDAKRVTNVWALRDINSRWQLYRYWVNEYCKLEQRKMDQVQEKYENLSQELKEVRVEEDLSILRKADVIGMTTTGAAKHRSVLQRAGPKIVVVEEAAEVLESHIITTLSADCQHLILIGDHQQLRPNPTVYRLAQKYNLDISLFERMLKNGVPCQTLAQQHRMRPEISTIMKNHFYENLQDHESVKSYPHVGGIGSDVFFLNHDIREEDVADSQSKSNQHEAEVLVGLCKYLIQQGQYQPSQITILTTYVGQLFKLRRRMPKNIFDGVRVCVVDNFQGEENDIILLSLVRSNEKGNIGFLKVSNRMCVALSRARHGFFCIGNFEVLASEPLWKNIILEMKGKGFFGQDLNLVCHNHPKTITQVKTGQDFLDVPEGGCALPCEFRLDCGHSCPKMCHPTDPEHKDSQCLKRCDRAFKCGHRCKLKCFQPCGKCTEQVLKTLGCGHQRKLPCYQRPESAACLEVCGRRLACGHRCREKCGEECTVDCQDTIIRSDWPCGHTVSVKCNDGPDKCPEKCKVILECSHLCTGTCGSCQRGRLHKQCDKKCKRILVCGHECTALCTRDCPPCNELCQNRCVHSKCFNRCGDVCTPCMEPCPWRCRHYKCSKKCSEPCDRPSCDQPCPLRLECRHPCIGLCGELCPDKCLVCNQAEVTDIFFGSEDEPDARFVQLEDCNHIFEVNGLDHWMKIEKENQTSVQLKECPRCKTTIRRNLRYGRFINEKLADIEKAKQKIFGDKQQISAKKEEISRSLRYDMEGVDYIQRKMESPQLSLRELLVIENQVNLLKAIRQAQKAADTHKEIVLLKMKPYKNDLLEMRKWLLKPHLYLSQQQLEDCSYEVQRLSMCIDLTAIKDKLPSEDRSDPSLKIVEDLVLNGKPLQADSRKTVQALLKKLQYKCTGLHISNAERIMIVKAMGLSQGHWYKCPNGHVYAIGDCGGASVTSRCPDCSALIGGTNHRLVDNNAVATEMDGARYSAWSEQANLANYDPADF